MSALQESIKKWEAIVAGTGHDKGVHNCSLCKAYSDEDCIECPVMEVTGMSGCDGSPWMVWSSHQTDDHNRKDQGGDIPNFNYHCEPGCQECIDLATDELNFLRELL
jgi:hypothetical protein